MAWKLMSIVKQKSRFSNIKKTPIFIKMLYAQKKTGNDEHQMLIAIC